MGRVYLIGGSPMVGKSTVAAIAASKRCIPCLSTDDIGEALQAVAPALNPMQGRDFRDYYAKTPLAEQIASMQKFNKAMEPALRRLIEIHSTWGGSLLMEGWALYPDRLPLHNLMVSAVWLVATEGLLEARMAKAAGFLSGAAADHYLLRSKWHNELLLAQCKAARANYIVADGGETPEALAEEIAAVWLE